MVGKGVWKRRTYLGLLYKPVLDGRMSTTDDVIGMAPQRACFKYRKIFGSFSISDRCGRREKCSAVVEIRMLLLSKVYSGLIAIY